MFPSSIISFSTKVNGAVIDAGDVNSPQTEITAIETKVGTDGSADTTSLDYKITNPASDGGGHVQKANKGGTGQTSYTKGDILVATSSSVLGKQAVGGTDGYALVVDSTQTNGVKWGLPGNSPVVRTYTSSVITVWTRPSILSYLAIEVVGNGGTGGTSGNGNGTQGGSGGGGGGYAKRVIAASSVLASQNVLARGGGVGSVLSYFGSILGATGGTNAALTTPGVGGIGSSGDINCQGQGGGIGSVAKTTGQDSTGGIGGSSPLGGGGAGGNTGDVGGNGGGYGGGGGGGGSAGSAGGAGAGGIVIVYEY